MIEDTDRRKEGLRALARFMAEAYRKGKTYHGFIEPVVSHDKVVGKIERDPKTNSTGTPRLLAQVFHEVQVDVIQSENPIQMAHLTGLGHCCNRRLDAKIEHRFEVFAGTTY